MLKIQRQYWSWSNFIVANFFAVWCRIQVAIARLRSKIIIAIMGAI